MRLKPRIARTTRAIVASEITDETPIVRYIRLSTFLLLLAGRVFVPTLRNLQRAEKLEGRVPDLVWKNYAENLFIDLEAFKKWLFDRGTKSPSLPADLRHSVSTIDRECSRAIGKDFRELELLAKIWLHELSIPRPPRSKCFYPREKTLVNVRERVYVVTR